MPTSISKLVLSSAQPGVPKAAHEHKGIMTRLRTRIKDLIPDEQSPFFRNMPRSNLRHNNTGLDAKKNTCMAKVPQNINRGTEDAESPAETQSSNI